MAWSRLCDSKTRGGMGFKNLHRFNLALLAKQGWRLITNPLSTVSLLFKARYFTRGDLLTPNIGVNPSYGWRSILAGQQILRQGCYKRIGDGRATNVWDQPWLPEVTNPYVDYISCGCLVASLVEVLNQG
nr:uncharacterized protein LOC109176397 [Ipomoea batatas]